MKTTLVATDWRPLVRNTLRGFARIEIWELRMAIHDVAIHEKDGRRWAALPARPQLKEGKAITDDAGKIQYLPVMSFESRAVADAFSAAVITAVLKHAPHAFDESGERPVAREMADETPF